MIGLDEVVVVDDDGKLDVVIFGGIVNDAMMLYVFECCVLLFD